MVVLLLLLAAAFSPPTFSSVNLENLFSLIIDMSPSLPKYTSLSVDPLRRRKEGEKSSLRAREKCVWEEEGREEEEEENQFRIML